MHIDFHLLYSMQGHALQIDLATLSYRRLHQQTVYYHALLSFPYQIYLLLMQTSYNEIV